MKWLSKRRLLVIFLLLFGFELIAWGAARLLMVEASITSADAIVVLSGSATARERTMLASELYKNGRGPKIILSNDNRKGGWSAVEQRNPYFYEHSQAELHRLGVPREAIDVLMLPVANTFDEALAFKQYAQKNHLRSMLIVTSGYHSRRALWTFRRVSDGQIGIGLEAVRPGVQTPRPLTWWLYPSGWEMVPVEYLKLIYYRVRYA